MWLCAISESETEASKSIELNENNLDQLRKRVQCFFHIYFCEWILSVNLGCQRMLKKMMAAGIFPQSPTQPKLQSPFIGEMDTRRTLIEPEFPQNAVKWKRNAPAPASTSCKGVYAYVSSPKTIYTTRKLTSSMTTSQYVYYSVYFRFLFILILYSGCLLLLLIYVWMRCVTSIE